LVLIRPIRVFSWLKKIFSPHRDSEPECRPVARDRIDPDHPTVRFDHSPRDRQAQTGGFFSARGSRGKPGKILKQAAAVSI
jgi:hypothetical protein